MNAKQIRKLTDHALKEEIRMGHVRIENFHGMIHALEKQLDKLTEDLDRLSDEDGRRKYLKESK